MRRIFFAATVALLAAPAAFAETARAPNEAAVAFHDLDLSDRAQASEMLIRIERAARQACGDTPARRALSEIAAIRACEVEAVATAVNRLSAPELSALHARSAPASRATSPLVVAAAN